MSAPPGGVVHLENDVDVDGSHATFGHWLLIPDADAGSGAYWLGLMSSYQLDVGGALLQCMHSGASLVTCRVTVGGIVPERWQQAWPPNHGGWTGGQALNVSCGLYLATLGGGRGSGSRLHLPAVPDIFIADGVRLTAIARGNLTELADRLTTWALGVTGPTGAAVTLGTLQTRDAGAPLPMPTFDPARFVTPSLRVETLRRRLPRSGRVSPE